MVGVRPLAVRSASLCSASAGTGKAQAVHGRSLAAPQEAHTHSHPPRSHPAPPPQQACAAGLGRAGGRRRGVAAPCCPPTLRSSPGRSRGCSGPSSAGVGAAASIGAPLQTWTQLFRARLKRRALRLPKCSLVRAESEEQVCCWAQLSCLHSLCLGSETVVSEIVAVIIAADNYIHFSRAHPLLRAVLEALLVQHASGGSFLSHERTALQPRSVRPLRQPTIKSLSALPVRSNRKRLF